MVSSWQRFVRNAPPRWKEDGWMASRTPVGVATAYGQNLPIRGPASTRQDSAHWTASRDYNTARFLSTAIATHLESAHIYFIQGFLSHASLDFVK